nr:tetratricopeptide repeat protein [Noviherbaspirillum saxi]
MNHLRRNTPSKADLLFHKAFTTHQMGDLETAEELYRRALQKSPSDMETLYLLGTVCSQQGKFDDAVKYLKKSLQLAPNHPEALNNLGLTLKGMLKEKEAIAYYRRALAVRPDYADAYNNLGGALETIGELDEAEQYLRKALVLNPHLADAYYNLGMVLKGKDRFEESVHCFLRGMEMKPGVAIAYDHLGSIYKFWGRFDEALTCLDRAILMKPSLYSAHNNRGAVLEELGRFDEALAEYERAVELDPNEATPRWNQAFLFLRQGILDRGWEAHELRLKVGQVLERFPYPQWDGSSLENKTILVYAEQGLGDEILFASCFADIIARAKHCVIECEPRLAPLFTRTFPTATVVGAPRFEIGWLVNIPKIDVQIPAGSLPRFFRPTLDSFPARPQYLIPDAGRVEHWRSRLALLGPGLKVGICWRSGLRKGERHKYYSQISQWGAIFAVPGVHFVNLQYGECAEELLEAEQLFGIKIASYSDIDLRNDIDDSAALMASVDLMICASTSVSEIGGAVGVEQYRYDPFGRHWDVLGCSDRMPWHPSIRLFQQHTQYDWDTQLATVAAVLKERVCGVEQAEYVELSDHTRIAVSGSVGDMASYVLKEQQGWMEAEHAFALAVARPGMQVVDTDAGLGEYAIPLAKKVGDGKVFALTRTADHASLLMKSRAENQLEETLSVSIAAGVISLDTEMDRQGYRDASIVRIAADTSTMDMLSASMRFFSVQSPLILFGITPGGGFDVAVVEWFANRGYGLYRLVPGLNLLIPCSSTSELDQYSRNLFAARAERAEALEQRGLLIRSANALSSFPGIDRTDWQDFLKRFSYAVRSMAAWIDPAERQSGWEVYWMGLHLFAMAKSDRPAAERFACLQAALNVLTTLAQEKATLPRLLSLARVLIEAGRREMAVNLLNQICSLIQSGLHCSLDEPCFALDAHYEQTDPGERISDWIVAMVLECRERLRAFSSFFTLDEGLAVLEEVHASGFASDEVARRIVLIQRRQKAVLQATD